jgi:hypothetical protein
VTSSREDSHLQVNAHAGRTKSEGGAGSPSPPWNPFHRIDWRAGGNAIRRLFGRGLHRYDGDKGAALGLGTVLDAAVDQGE